jgi:hypothetical protein
LLLSLDVSFVRGFSLFPTCLYIIVFFFFTLTLGYLILLTLLAVAPQFTPSLDARFDAEVSSSSSDPDMTAASFPPVLDVVTWELAS